MVIVYGQPRSGTSMMMRVMEFGGVLVEYDNDAWRDKIKYRNPYGFFEIGRPSFTKCFKCFQPRQLEKLPQGIKIIYIVRELEQHIKSWEQINPKDHHRQRVIRMREIFQKALEGMDFLTIQYEDMQSNPAKECQRIKDYLGEFDVEKAVTAVDQTLYVRR